MNNECVNHAFLRNLKIFILFEGQIQSTEVYYKHRFMNRTDATSQDPHYIVAKISNESTKKQNSVNSNRDATQNDNIALGNAKENDLGSGSLSYFLFHFYYHCFTFLVYRTVSRFHFEKYENFQEFLLK